MPWSSLSEKNKNATPRKLTETEIEDILASVPLINAISSEAAELSRKNNCDKLRFDLQAIEISPNGIDELKKRITHRFYSSLITPNSLCGIWAAESISERATQSNLSSFHHAGASKNLLAGVNTIRSLVESSKRLKNVYSYVYFQDKHLSYIDSLRKGRELVGVTVKSLIEDSQIFPSDEIKNPWWVDAYLLLNKINIIGKKLPIVNEQNHKISFKMPGYIMRLKLNKNLMYQYRITMNKIIATIENYYGVYVISSPTSEGIIDIYPDETKILDVLNKKGFVSIDKPSLLYLDMVVLPEMDKITIQGIEGIKSIIPNILEVLDIVKSETKISDNKFKYLFNVVRIRTTGIMPSKLVNLLRVAKSEGVNINWDDSNLTPDNKYSFTYDPGYLIVESKDGKSPFDWIKELISEKERDESKNYFMFRIGKNEDKLSPPISHPILKASKVTIIVTEGSNLKQIVSRDDVDSTRTYSNNIHEMADVFGIHASRNFYIKEFYRLVGSIDIRHIELLSQFTYASGRPSGITFSSVSKQPVGFMSLATAKESLKVFSRAALFGKSEKIPVDTSACLYVGKKINAGTGNIEVLMTDENGKMVPYDVEKIGFEKSARELDNEDVIYEGDNMVNVGEEKDDGVLDNLTTDINPPKEKAIEVTGLDLPTLNITEKFIKPELEEKVVKPVMVTDEE